MKHEKRNWFNAVALMTGMAAATVSAKTIALWPLNYEANSTLLNTRCLIAPENDLTAYNPSMGNGVSSWDYPPNPDATSNLLGSARNNGSVYASYFGNSTLANKITLDKDFTIEGWMSRSANPASNTWCYVFGGQQNGIDIRPLASHKESKN